MNSASRHVGEGESKLDGKRTTTTAPARRLVLLGASNLTRSFPTVVATACTNWREPVEIMAAMGHGRSYGQDSTVFGRKISGIFPCALWQDLQTRPTLPTAALVTDIGNDLLYGVAPETLLDWVARCLDLLQEAGAETIVTQLPTESVERLTAAQFAFYRRLLFPRSSLSLDAAKRMVHSFNERLVRLAETKKTPVIPVSGAWYGIDPIHIKRRAMRVAWPEMFSGWRALDEPFEARRPSLWMAAYLAALAPWERWIFGIRRCSAQPSGRLADGSTISLY